MASPPRLFEKVHLDGLPVLSLGNLLGFGDISSFEISFDKSVQLISYFPDFVAGNNEGEGASQFCKLTILVGLKPLSVNTFREPLTKMGCSQYITLYYPFPCQQNGQQQRQIKNILISWLRQENKSYFLVRRVKQATTINQRDRLS